jgi:predicted dehydrogenase
MKTVRFGIVGCGLMGREFASATARWCHLLEPVARPEIVAVCSRGAASFPWFKERFPSIAQLTHDYRELMANPAVEAVYVAVPHHLHREICCAAIQAGKHLMGEKPLGIDQPANQAILEALKAHPAGLGRCFSPWAF